MLSEKMRRIAANEVVTEDSVLSPGVVELCSGMVTGCYHLNEELPFTEWIGGTIIIMNDNDNCLRAFKNGNLIK